MSGEDGGGGARSDQAATPRDRWWHQGIDGGDNLSGKQSEKEAE